VKMPSHRQRRRVFYGVFASIFFLAAVGLLYLVWATVRGIPLDEARRFGESQTRSLKVATGRFLDKIDWISGVHHDLIAYLPGIDKATKLDPQHADAATNIALSRLEGLLQSPQFSSFDIYRISENGDVTSLYPTKFTPSPPTIDAKRAKQIVEAARTSLETTIPRPEIFELKGRPKFRFIAPIRPSGTQSFAGAVVLEAPAIPLLQENVMALRSNSTFFLLEWPEDSLPGRPGGQPKMLWNSTVDTDEPRSGEKNRWKEEFLRTLGEYSQDIRNDPEGRGYQLTLPSVNEGDRVEVVSHVPIFLRWGVGMSTPYEHVHANASGQRLMLITLGSVALGILAAAVVFFVIQVVQRERELKAVEASYQGLFAENPTSMLVLDEEGRIIDCNFSAVKLLGLLPKDAKGKLIFEIFTPESVGPLWKALAEQGNLHAIDVRWKRQDDGAETVAEVWGRRIGDRWMLMAHDVGERREFEQQMARLKRMDSMGALASTLAHDFNNLLGQIQIMVSNLRADFPPNSEAAVDLLAVEGKVEDASQLVAGILAFRENVVSAEPVHLEPVLRDFVAAQRKVLPEGITLASSIDSDLPSVWITPQGLRRVLDNLCKNASDAMPDGGMLSIRCTRRHLETTDAKQGLSAGVYAVIEVGDTGMGVSEATLEKLFQPFFTTKAGGRGTGLGLWTVYKIMRQIGGDIRVQSRIGRGTRFELMFPHHPPTAENSWIRKEKFELA
jgi:PAS domain S-box-containing protein